MSVQFILVCMKDGLILACVSGSAENYSALVFKNQEVRNKFECAFTWFWAWCQFSQCFIHFVARNWQKCTIQIIQLTNFRVDVVPAFSGVLNSSIRCLFPLLHTGLYWESGMLIHQVKSWKCLCCICNFASTFFWWHCIKVWNSSAIILHIILTTIHIWFFWVKCIWFNLLISTVCMTWHCSLLGQSM